MAVPKRYYYYWSVIYSVLRCNFGRFISFLNTPTTFIYEIRWVSVSITTSGFLFFSVDSFNQDPMRFENESLFPLLTMKAIYSIPYLLIHNFICDSSCSCRILPSTRIHHLYTPLSIRQSNSMPFCRPESLDISYCTLIKDTFLQLFQSNVQYTWNKMYDHRDGISWVGS